YLIHSERKTPDSAHGPEESAMPEKHGWSEAEFLDIVGSLETGEMPTVVVNAPFDKSLAGSNPSSSSSYGPRGHWPTVSVVIPAHNEARNLPFVLRELPELVTEVILVDGNSTDATVDVARVLWPDIVITGQPGRGKGDALRAGVALSHGEIIVLMDADGSTRPQEIELFVAALISGHADYVKGSRYLSGGGSEDFTPLRRLGNWSLNACANLLYHTHFTDFCYGFNAFWRECIPVIPIECDGFEVEAQLNCRAVRSGLRIIEVPSIERPRQHGESHLMPLRDGWRILRAILRERHWKPTRAAVPDTQSRKAMRWKGQRITSAYPPSRPNAPRTRPRSATITPEVQRKVDKRNGSSPH
ncbi:MAG TPA: glycosyltransferase family 2 protein, partial [Ktedonobacterales bacterium]|nr:glycosyltransferase family 2 protein [Ktedonobacterales bacterium]